MQLSDCAPAFMFDTKKLVIWLPSPALFNVHIAFPEMEGDSKVTHDWCAIGFGDEDGARHEDEFLSNNAGP